MEFRHLRYFIAVAEELHFGQAAARLNMSQPPLSQQIRQLEEDLGVELFHRSKHHVELTEAGKVFLEEARTMLAYAEQARDAAEKANQGATGRLTVGLLGSTTYTVAPLFRKYCTRFPLVNLTVHQMNTGDQLQALHERRIHLGIMRTPIHNPIFASETFISEPLVAVHHEMNPLASRERLRVQDLADEPLILPQRRYAATYHDAVIHLCRQSGFTPRIAFELPEIITMLAFVAEGMGTALVPASFRNQLNQGIVYRDLHDTSASLDTYLVWRQDDRSPTLRQFLHLGFATTTP